MLSEYDHKNNNNHHVEIYSTGENICYQLHQNQRDLGSNEEYAMYSVKHNPLQPEF